MAAEKDIKTCESCGKSFGCGVNAESCWCFDVDLPQSKAAEIRDKFSNCLCPKCLCEYSSASGMVVIYPDGRTETIDKAVRVDTQNFHEGMYDFYDEHGNLLEQINMSSGIAWEHFERKLEK